MTRRAVPVGTGILAALVDQHGDYPLDHFAGTYLMDAAGQCRTMISYGDPEAALHLRHGEVLFFNSLIGGSADCP